MLPFIPIVRFITRFRRSALPLLLFVFGWFTGAAQSIAPSFVTAASHRWADSVSTALMPDERIGQFLMVAGYSG